MERAVAQSYTGSLTIISAPGRAVSGTHDPGASHGQHVMRRALLALGGVMLTGHLPLPIRDCYSVPVYQQSVGGAAQAATVLGEPTTDPRMILREALPVQLPQPLLDLDEALLAIGGGSRGSRRSAAGSRSIAQSDMLAENQQAIDAQRLAASIRRASNATLRASGEIIAAVPLKNQPEAKKLLEEIGTSLSKWEQTRTNSNSAAVEELRNDMLNISGQLQSLLVPEVNVPAEYASLPQLRGRAVAEIMVRTSKQNQKHLLTVILDGINAPVTAGNFVDLCQKGFYDNMKIQRADGFVVQTGEDGSGGKRHPIPMEVRYEGEVEPTYGLTKEELGLMRKQVVLPFNALGTLAMARDESDANSANTQVFFLNKESEVTPSGANVLDGNYSVFGYLVENQDVLNQLRVNDTIESIRITYGAGGFIPASASSA